MIQPKAAQELAESITARIRIKNAGTSCPTDQQFWYVSTEFLEMFYEGAWGAGYDKGEREK